MKKLSLMIAILVAMLTLTGSAWATGYSVLVNTSSLSSATPLTLDFYLLDGSGVGDGNTKVGITGINLGGGSFIGGGTLTGLGASGDLATGINLTDTDFFSQFQQGFTPGAFLSFSLSIYGGIDDPNPPDMFAFLIDELNSADGSGANSLLTADFSTANPNITAYPATTFVNGGNVVQGVTPAVSVPEPASIMLLGAGALFGALRRKKRT